jgi:hypothetical protein
LTDRNRTRRAWQLAAAAACALLPAAGSGRATETLHLRCTNPTSGTSWPLVVDVARASVGSLPAAISDKEITWRDPKQGFFALDRATGALELRNASSTGGYFLHYTCRPE